MITRFHLAAGCLFWLVCATAANAQFRLKGEDAMHFNQVDDLIKNAPDDTKVSLRGHIIQQLSDEHYLFTDSGAVILIEIDERFEWSAEINEETLLAISGRVERDQGRVELEVTQVRILGPSS